MKSFLIAVTLSPLLINLLVRTYAWLVLLGDTGVVNTWLRAAGMDRTTAAAQRQQLFSVIVGLVHIGLPLMVLSLIGVLERMDKRPGRRRGQPRRLAGAHPAPHRAAAVTARASAPGRCWCSRFTISAFITPALLGGNRVSTISTLIYEKFTFSSNWPVGATLVMVLLVINVAVVALHGRLFPRRSRRDARQRRSAWPPGGWWCCSSWGR